jgi:multicomponent Na+:H+ antiporter subunit C
MNGVAIDLYFVVASIIAGLSLYSLVSEPHLLRKIMAVNIMGSAVFIVYGAIARRNWEGISDPVPQAMVITGIVVSVSATAFALIILRELHALTGRTDLGEEEESDR